MPQISRELRNYDVAEVISFKNEMSRIVTGCWGAPKAFFLIEESNNDDEKGLVNAINRVALPTSFMEYKFKVITSVLKWYNHRTHMKCADCLISSEVKDAFIKLASRQ